MYLRFEMDVLLSRCPPMEDFFDPSPWGTQPARMRQHEIELYHGKVTKSPKVMNDLFQISGN